jgi:sigma-E factor negative regulatory protein RseA
VAVIRDERLDEFLRAHQATRGGMGAALPGGAIRRVELEATAPR